MENFVYNDKFYGELTELSEELFETEEGIHNLPDDWSIECTKCNLEPMEILSISWITERIDDERLSESEYELEELHKILNNNIDFDKINSLMPKLYYERWKDKFTISKKDLIYNL